MGEQIFLTVQSDYHKIQVPVDEILYITIEGRKTKITRTDGSAVCTNRSLKDIYAELSEDLFSSINRGIVVSRKHIKQERDGIITMTDGATFRRRVRSDRLPQREKLRAAQMEERKICPAETLEQWMGRLPVPMCVMEMVYRSRGRGVEFVLRYCNGAMETLENIRLADVKDKPLEQVPGIGSDKWLTVFADVAVNGSSRVTEDIWEPSGKFMRLYCYQPQPGFCALMMVDLTQENKLVQELFKRGK